MTRKLCGGCMRLRDYSEFHKDPSKSTGMHSRCAECTNRERREHRRRRRERGQTRLFADDSSQAPPFTAGVKSTNHPRPEGRGLGVGTVNLPGAPEERADKKTQDRCHHRVARAINMGVLSRPQRCTVCRRSRDEVGTLHAHHEDYTNPLSVVFLCKSCHEIVHNEKKKVT